MKVLQLCSKVPFPAIDGGCLAMYNMAMMLTGAGYKVKTFAIATRKHPVPAEGFPLWLFEQTQIEAFKINTTPNFFKGLMKIIASDQSYVYSRFYNRNLEKRLFEVLNEFDADVVLLESALMFNYLPAIRKYKPGTKIIYRSHNIEHHIWKLLAEQAGNFFRKIYFNIEAKRIAALEAEANKKVDATIAITDHDRKFYLDQHYNKPLITIPFTIDIEKYPARHYNSYRRILHIGAMDYQPNVEGVKWFINEVWDKLFKQNKQAKFFIAGKAMPDDPVFYHDGIVNNGEVNDAIDFFANASIVIVPIWSGAGIKVKIIEAMALGKTVITTPHGSEGTNALPGHDILVANNTVDFIRLINSCWDNAEFAKQIGKNARKFIEENFSFDSKIVALQQFIDQVAKT